MGLNFIEGNEAVAMGAMDAGCRFFAGYPITPATSIYNAMLKYLPPMGGVCLQGEDEIASIGFCLGASMAGMKVMTATSGPGISLYSEQISFAVGSEIPLVIINVQRLGPSTGSATLGADGDIQFMRWGNSGGQPVIVLAPVDVADCYTLTMQAFNLAEQFRCPVFLAANKEISMTRESIDLEALEKPSVIDRNYANQDKPFLPFGTEAENDVPDFMPIGGKQVVRQTSSTHGPEGYITVDSQIIRETQERLFRKINNEIDSFTYFETLGSPDAETLVICYGVTARAAKAAVKDVQAQGGSVSLLILKTLWPLPETLIRAHCSAAKRIVVPEMNMGQYVHEIERIAAPKPITFLGQMNGKLIEPDQILEVLRHV